MPPDTPPDSFRCVGGPIDLGRTARGWGVARFARGDHHSAATARVTPYGYASLASSPDARTDHHVARTSHHGPSCRRKHRGRPVWADVRLVCDYLVIFRLLFAPYAAAQARVKNSNTVQRQGGRGRWGGSRP